MARVRGEMEDAYVQQCRDHNDADQADGPPQIRHQGGHAPLPDHEQHGQAE
jgi:hypothetical protein